MPGGQLLRADLHNEISHRRAGPIFPTITLSQLVSQILLYQLNEILDMTAEYRISLQFLVKGPAEFKRISKCSARISIRLC
jgi:hypothetical protein